MAKVAASTNSNDAVVQWVTFRLADEIYGINVMQVQEVLRVSEIAPVPGAPHYVLGIINLRGNVVTVIDTRIRLGLATAEVTDATRIVIIEGATCCRYPGGLRCRSRRPADVAGRVGPQCGQRR